MSDLQLIPVVIAIVGLVRSKAPRIDGLLVVPVAFLVAMLALFGLTEPTTPLDMLRRAVHVTLESMGLLFGLGYGAAKLGEGMGKGIVASIRPPADPGSPVDAFAPPAPRLPSDPTKAPLRVSLAGGWALATVLGTVVALLGLSCGYGKPACAVIDVAHQACTVIRYMGKDGKPHDVHVTREELEAMAVTAEARRAAEVQPDGGAP